MIVAGNHIYEECPECRKMVKISGWLGWWHLCLPRKRRGHPYA